ncbi:hypothetical protein BsWGS_17771 [Bradybaena similaris]
MDLTVFRYPFLTCAKSDEDVYTGPEGASEMTVLCNPHTSCDYIAGYFSWCSLWVYHGEKHGSAIKLCEQKTERRANTDSQVRHSCVDIHRPSSSPCKTIHYYCNLYHKLCTSHPISLVTPVTGHRGVMMEAATITDRFRSPCSAKRTSVEMLCLVHFLMLD